MDLETILATHEHALARHVDSLSPAGKARLCALAFLGVGSSLSLVALLAEDGDAAGRDEEPPIEPRRRTARATEANIAWSHARRDAVVDVVRRIGPCTSTEIAAELGCDPSTLGRHLGPLVAEGRICLGMHGRAMWSARYAMTQAEADEAARGARFTVKRPGRPSAVAAKVLAEPAHLGGQGANASTSSDRADSAAPSEPDERPSLVEAEVSPLASASTPPREDEDLDSARPVRTLAEMMRDEADEEIARRDRAAAEARRRAGLARTVGVPVVVLAGRRSGGAA